MAELLAIALAEGGLHGVHGDGNETHRDEVGYKECSASITIEKVWEAPYISIADRVANACKPVLQCIVECFILLNRLILRILSAFLGVNCGASIVLFLFLGSGAG